MMRRPVNELQVKVLRWLADGSPADRAPTAGSVYKTSAYALQGRGLAAVDRRRGTWRAEITDAGRYYLAHGTYPAAKPTVKPKLARPRPQRLRAAPPTATKQQVTTDAHAGRPATQSDDTRSVDASKLPVVSQIRKPHPAIRELLDHPKRIDLPAEARRRVQLISHTLVQEALRRGWKVTAVNSQIRDRWPSGRERWWPSNDLFRIDAGEQEVGIQFRMKTTRIDHVDTPEEARKRADGQYVFIPRYDYRPTDVLRLFLYDSTHHVASWEDTARIPLESRLAAVLDRIDQATKAVIARREAERRRWEEEQRRLEEERQQHQRVSHYDMWVDAFLALHRHACEHAELAAFVVELRGRIGQIDDEGIRVRFDTFLGWAEAHLEASDPLMGLNLPVGGPPEMSFADWSRWKTYFDGQQRRSALPSYLR
jgi:hypothetical protein